MDELERLIEEQAHDMGLGGFQSPEPFVAFSLDKTTVTPSGDGGVISEFFSEGENLQRTKATSKGCSIHGYRGYIYRPDGRTWCQPCNVERLALRRRLKGVPTAEELGRHPDGRWRSLCRHDPSSRKYTPKGQPYCTDCKREYRHRNAEKYREYDRNRKARRKSEA